MTAAELRIGNWVNINGWDCDVAEISTNQIHISNGIEPYLLEYEVEPIPLTKEWLVRFGFEPHSGIYFRTLNYSAYIAIGNDGSCGLYNSLSDYNRGNSFNQMKQIDYVHQLQNLYFALTGQELELKP